MHTKQIADILIHVIDVVICGKYGGKVKLIGSLGKGAHESKHDIDIHITCKQTDRLKNDLKLILRPEKVENTDWGGWYFHGTPFGDVDVFFTTKNFDY